MAGSAGGEDEDMIAGINVTPLVDITLVLLIIFIATSSIIIKAEAGMTLPDAKTAEQSGQGLINVTVMKQGTDKALIYMQGQIVENQATLRRDLEAEKKLDKDVKVIISADQQIDYQEVSDIVDAIRKSGISNFALDVMRID
ncbi:MAG: biopolymer transporter ExbD [Deltaproteobacteria bacterium]|jgi:biopolymer transport protein ExbD|nr:biopolymer transporter ExbD [Deltaproteobacteria bacterium]